MKVSTNQFKNGTKLLIDNAPCSIIEHEFHKPGKGQAVMRVKYKNLLSLSSIPILLYTALMFLEKTPDSPNLVLDFMFLDRTFLKKSLSIFYFK